LTEGETRGRASQFIESVLQLKPAVAAVDCDGTLWSGDAGADFFYWEMDRGIVDAETATWARARYDGYRAGDVDEVTMCGEMATLHRGLSSERLAQAAEEFFVEVVAPRVFPELQELTHRLADQGCELWAVSSTNIWVVEAAARRFSIAPERILAACTQIEEGCVTERLIRVPTDDLKAVAIREEIGKPVDAVFGNSIHDEAMLAMARYPFCVNPNPDLAAVAKERNWTVYWPESSIRR
jgi:phosphoserine phosphatase